MLSSEVLLKYAATCDVMCATYDDLSENSGL